MSSSWREPTLLTLALLKLMLAGTAGAMASVVPLGCQVSGIDKRIGEIKERPRSRARPLRQGMQGYYATR